MQNRVLVSMLVVSITSTSLLATDCEALASKYNAPDPSVKTMKQVKRWVKRKVKDDNKAAVEKCLVGQAADNPNKSTVAGQ
jgi:hypothetical protein